MPVVTVKAGTGAGCLTPLVGVLNYRTAHSVRKGLNFIWGCVTLAMQYPDTSKKNLNLHNVFVNFLCVLDIPLPLHSLGVLHGVYNVD